MVGILLEGLGTTQFRRRWTKSANGSPEAWGLALHHLD
jgi:hypothetical protein